MSESMDGWGVITRRVEETTKLRGTTVPGGAYLVKNGWFFVPEQVPHPTKMDRSVWTRPKPRAGLVVRGMADYFVRFGIGTEVERDDELSWAVIAIFRSASIPRLWVFRFPEVV